MNRGIYMMVIASLFFAVMGALVKLLGGEINSVQIVFFRNVVGSGFILVSMLGKPLVNRGGHFGLLVFRGVAGTIALLALFYNMTQIGLGIAITYLQTSPIFVALFSHWFLGERLKLPGWGAIILGFIGILFIFKPDLQMSWTTNMLGLVNGILAGAAYTSVRALKSYYDTRSIVLSFMISGTLLPLSLLIVGTFIGSIEMPYLITEFEMPQRLQWLWLFLVGVVSLLGQIFVTRAYGAEKAGIVSAIGYITIPFSVVIGTILGDPWPDVWSVLGMIMIIGSGIIISIRRNI